jgi:condensin complex subunit 3
MLAQEQLPESLTRLCLDVMKEILPNERELIRVVVEIVREVRDREDIEGSPTVCRSSFLYPM